MIENGQRPVVTVFCICYNHAKYLRQALDSVVCQKTDFPFEVLVHDDASTDDSPKIILEYQKKYPGLIIPILQKENQNAKGVNRYTTFLFPITRGEFIAHLECDDFWCDPYKLQKQVDALRSNPDCVACVHSTALCNEKGELNGQVIPKRVFEQEVVSPEQIVCCVAQDDMFHTSSRMFRTALRKEMEYNKPYWSQQCKIVGDVPNMLFAAVHGPVYYIQEIMSVYRLQSIGSYSEKLATSATYFLNVRKEMVEMWTRFAHQYPQYENYAKERIERCRKEMLVSQMYQASMRDLWRIKTGENAEQYNKLERSIRTRAWMNSAFPWLRPVYQKAKRFIKR